MWMCIRKLTSLNSTGIVPTCMQSRMAFSIAFADFPVFWQSKLQIEIALSTMEAEVLAFNACFRALFPILDLVYQMGYIIGLKRRSGA